MEVVLSFALEGNNMNKYNRGFHVNVFWGDLRNWKESIFVRFEHYLLAQNKMHT